MREKIRRIIASIEAFDEIEAAHIQNALEWIDGGVEIFRLEKPATPPKHLVSFFVVVDVDAGKLMLVDHIKAERWIPAGGHVDKDEDPKDTVRREIQEELGIAADFIFEEPIFITETVTVGKTAGHTDVSLWYVVGASSEITFSYDPREFNGYKWFFYPEVLDTPTHELDPHMHRFTNKLLTLL